MKVQVSCFWNMFLSAWIVIASPLLRVNLWDSADHQMWQAVLRGHRPMLQLQSIEPAASNRSPPKARRPTSCYQHTLCTTFWYFSFCSQVSPTLLLGIINLSKPFAWHWKLESVTDLDSDKGQGMHIDLQIFTVHIPTVYSWYSITDPISTRS